MDHYDEGFDWIWKGIAKEQELRLDLENPVRKVIYDIMSSHNKGELE